MPENYWVRRAIDETGIPAGSNSGGAPGSPVPWVDPHFIDLASQGGNVWRDTPSPIRGEPTVQVPTMERRAAPRPPRAPVDDDEWFHQPGGERRFLPSPTSYGEPTVQVPRSPGRVGGSMPAGGSLSRLAGTPMSTAVGAGHVYVGNEYRPSINGQPMPSAPVPTGAIQIDPTTGRPYDLSGIPEATGPTETAGTGGFSEGGGSTTGGYGDRHDPTNPNDPETARQGLNMRIAMATAPGTPNFGGARRPQSDEGMNVNYPRTSGTNLQRDEEGGFYRTPARRGGGSSARMRAWAELLTSARGREQAAGMTRAQQQAYAGVGGG